MIAGQSPMSSWCCCMQYMPPHRPASVIRRNQTPGIKNCIKVLKPSRTRGSHPEIVSQASPADSVPASLLLRHPGDPHGAVQSLGP